MAIPVVLLSMCWRHFANIACAIRNKYHISSLIHSIHKRELIHKPFVEGIAFKLAASVIMEVYPRLATNGCESNRGCPCCSCCPCCPCCPCHCICTKCIKMYQNVCYPFQCILFFAAAHRTCIGVVLMDGHHDWP